MGKLKLVAVYGSLRKTMHNHKYYLTDSTFKGKFTTEPIYSMHEISSYPGLKLNGNTSIIMEVYEVSNSVLEYLDRLEGYVEGASNNHYDRIETPTPWGDAYLYIYKNKLSPESVVESGDWVEFKKNKEVKSFINN